VFGEGGRGGVQGIVERVVEGIQEAEGVPLE
jgi:hypothetical protein